MTTVLESKKQEREHERRRVWVELERIDQKTPEEAHKTIVHTMHNQQKTIDRLLQENRTLWVQLKKYKTNQELILEGQPQNSTQRIMKKIWDNKEDEFWDTF